MTRKYSSEYKNLQPYVIEDARSVANAVLAGATGGGGGTPGVTDHGRLTGLSDDDHPQYLTPVRGDARYIVSTRQVIAGNGLTGGGDLSADRTFDVAVSGLGLGVGADAITLTSSSDVGTTPAAAILASTAGGALTLSSLFVKGSVSLTNNGDLTVAGSGSYAGSNVLFADSSGGNVGIMTVPDPQFALDVNGPARATYFVGPHALQLKNVLLLSHYDGRLPYSSNFSGEVNGHMGQVATVTGTIIHRYGKFYKAGQFAAAATNLINDPRPNPSGTSTEWYYNAGTAPTNAVSTNMPEGAVGERVIYYANHQFGWPNAVSVTNAGVYYLTGWIIASTSGTINFYLQRNGGAYDTISNTVGLAVTANTWTRFTAGLVATATASSRVVFSGYGANVSICNWQFESANVTPYHDGGLTLASTWNGTAYASTSTRAASYLTYPTAGNMSIGALTIMAWVNVETVPATNQTILRLDGTTSGYIWLRLVAGKPEGIRGGGTSAQAAGAITARTWTHLAMTWDGTSTRLYVNGALADTDTPASAFVGMPTAMYVGGAAGATELLNGLIDDLCILDRAMPAAEIRSVYESNAPVFAGTSTFSFRPTPKGLIWADDEGLWMKASDGDTVLGVYGNDATTKNWGGQTMSDGDLLIGNATNYVFWNDDVATLTISGTVTAGAGAIGGWTLGATALTAGSGANTVGLDSGGTNPAFYAGSATPSSAPFRVTKTGDLTATSATLTGTIRAASGGVTGNWYVGYDVEYAGYLYAGTSGALRFGSDGQRLVLPNVTTFDVKVDIPTSSSALRWFSSLGLSWTSASNYTGQVCYRETTNKLVDWVAMSYVGSTDYATYYARSMLYANRYNGSTNKTCRVEAAVDPGAGGAYVTLDCDTAYTTAAMYVATNMSALSITDRTPHYEGDALAELRQVRGKTRTVKGKAVREIDHDSIPAFARVRVVDAKTNEARDERDLGAMISILTVAVQQLDARLDTLEARGNGRQ